MGAQRFKLRAYIDPDRPKGAEGAVRVSVWAANVRKPFEKAFAVRFTVENGDVRAVAAGALP